MKQKDAAEQANVRCRPRERRRTTARKGESSCRVQSERKISLRRFCRFLQQQKQAGSSLARANGTEWARISSREHVPRGRTPSSLLFCPGNWYNWPTTRLLHNAIATIAIAAAQNDNTRRSFGLIKGIVRQMLPSSTTPVNRSPVC